MNQHSKISKMLIGFFLLLSIVVASCTATNTGMNYDSFIQSLQNKIDTDPTNKEANQPFFSVKGKIVKVNNENINIFEYKDESSAKADASKISPDGSSIGTTMVTWVDEPHFYQNGKLIVLYVGKNKKILAALESSLGSSQIPKTPKKEIANFEECASAGYPILESYPRQCAIRGGKTFVEKINSNFDNKIVQDLCDYNKSDKFEPSVRISKDKEYYQVTMFMKIITRTYPPEISKIPAIDLPVLYYEKDGQLAALCGGYTVGETDPLCVDKLSKLEFGPNLCETELSQIITTQKGKLALEYQDGETVLSGSLFRSTPCVKWTIEISSTKDIPISQVSVNIFDSNKEAICIQVVGEPQEINRVIQQVSEDTNYDIILEDKEVFSGELR